MKRIYPAEFILYVYFRTFKTYLWALSLFSLTITIVFSSAAKYLYLQVTNWSNNAPFIKELFQLSYLLYIPVFIVLLTTKYKKKFIEDDPYSALSMPRIVAWFFTILLLLALLFLFVYVLAIW